MQFFISFLSGIALFYSSRYFPLSSFFIFLFSSIWLVFKKRFFLIPILLLGFAFAFIRYEPQKEIPYINNNVYLKGTFTSYPTKTDTDVFKQNFLISNAYDLESNRKLSELDEEDIVLFSDREFYPWTENEISARFLKNRVKINPGARDRDILFANLIDVYNLGNKKISFKSKIEDCRYNLNRYIEENFKKDSGALISSITTGLKTNINEDMQNAFNRTGLAHILSISGTHFGLFSVLLFWTFTFLIKHLPYSILQRITIFLTPSQAAAILCLPFILTYLGLSGASVPAVRSFIMINLFLFGLIIDRKDFWLNSLVFAAFVLVMWNPEVIFNLSFQLSFLAVLFIGFSIRNKEKGNKEERKSLRYVKNTLLITLSASIGTAPLVAYYFHYLSIISPLSNLLITPITGFVLIPLSVISSFFFIITGHFIFTPLVSLISDISISIVKLLSDIPFSDIKVPAFPPIILLLFYAGFIFYFIFNKRKLALTIPFIPVIIYLSLCIFEKKDISVTHIDVGQGDSSVIELPDNTTLVIDTGKTGRETASFLTFEGKRSIDALILSHIHPDHTGGLEYLIKRFHVREIWHNGRLILPETSSEIKHRVLTRGDIVEGKYFSMYVLHPYPEYYSFNGNEYVEANNDSLVLKFLFNKKAFLFTGDVEEDAEKDILHLGNLVDSDVMKVPHHGSKTSAYEPFFESVSPDIAVISVGNNAFGHPHHETLNALNRARIYRTDIDGAIKISETDNGLKIKTCRDFQFTRTKSLYDEIENIKRLFQRW
jgi:competence protein ComEC